MGLSVREALDTLTAVFVGVKVSGVALVVVCMEVKSVVVVFIVVFSKTFPSVLLVWVCVVLTNQVVVSEMTVVVLTASVTAVVVVMVMVVVSGEPSVTVRGGAPEASVVVGSTSSESLVPIEARPRSRWVASTSLGEETGAIVAGGKPETAVSSMA